MSRSMESPNPLPSTAAPPCTHRHTHVHTCPVLCCYTLSLTRKLMGKATIVIRAGPHAPLAETMYAIELSAYAKTATKKATNVVKAATKTNAGSMAFPVTATW